jgi:hypothetical protein
MLTALLPRLPQLKSLELTCIRHPEALKALRQQLGSLQQLRSFALVACRGKLDPYLLQLSSTLTSLQLAGGPDESAHVSIGSKAVPAAGWPLLRKLCLTKTAFQPALLTQFTGLEILQLSGCALVSLRWVLQVVATTHLVTAACYHQQL